MVARGRWVGTYSSAGESPFLHYLKQSFGNGTCQAKRTISSASMSHLLPHADADRGAVRPATTVCAVSETQGQVCCISGALKESGIAITIEIRAGGELVKALAPCAAPPPSRTCYYAPTSGKTFLQGKAGASAGCATFA